jgi:flavin reductase
MVALHPALGEIAPYPKPWPWADPASFRDGLAKLASGVAIVACWDGGRPRGLLVSSLIGLSTEPPRLLFCIRKASMAHAAILRCDGVGVSILRSDDHEEAQRFSQAERVGERFAPDLWRLDPAAPPTRRGALAAFTGQVRSRIDAGSHTVIILDASTVELGLRETAAADPLLYFEHGFRARCAKVDAGFAVTTRSNF